MGIGFVVLGHGSKVAETIDILKKITASLEKRLQGDDVRYAALQFNEPSLPETIAGLVGEGIRDIVILPLFLTDGNHVRADIPEIIGEEKLKYPSVRIKMADHIGADVRITDILVDRVAEMLGSAISNDNGAVMNSPVRIEEESFRIIEESLDLSHISVKERAVVKRIIHACGDLSMAGAITVSGGAVDAGIEAIKSGCSIIADVRMVAIGISDRLAAINDNNIICKVNDQSIEVEAKRLCKTRSAMGIRSLGGYVEGGVIAIGNAPTALFELLNMVKEGCGRPALVVGTPVGFVGAAESKEALKNSGLSYVTVNGTRGGSAMAVAAVNATLRMACGEDTK